MSPSPPQHRSWPPTRKQPLWIGELLPQNCKGIDDARQSANTTVTESNLISEAIIRIRNAAGAERKKNDWRLERICGKPVPPCKSDALRQRRLRQALRKGSLAELRQGTPVETRRKCGASCQGNPAGRERPPANQFLKIPCESRRAFLSITVRALLASSKFPNSRRRPVANGIGAKQM